MISTTPPMTPPTIAPTLRSLSGGGGGSEGAKIQLTRSCGSGSERSCSSVRLRNSAASSHDSPMCVCGHEICTRCAHCPVRHAEAQARVDVTYGEVAQV